MGHSGVFIGAPMVHSNGTDSILSTHTGHGSNDGSVAHMDDGSDACTDDGSVVGNKNERSHFHKGVISLGSSSRLVHLLGKKTPDLLQKVVSLFEVRLENLTPA